MFRYKKGFTLAEVLITLLITGIVASIVIPNIIQDTQQAEFHTAWKKEYAIISQATLRIMNDNGGTIEGVFGNSDKMMNTYLSYLNPVKICPYGQIYGNCWHKNDGSSKVLTGIGITTWESTSAAIMNDSSFMLFTPSDCNITSTWAYIPICGKIIVDVNGFKGPNTIGKDMYGLYIFKNSIKPIGGANDRFQPDACRPDRHGWGCAAVYLYQ